MTRNEKSTTNDVGFKGLRIVAIAVGSVVMLLSLVAWFAYLGASLSGFDRADGPGLTNRGIVELFLAFWMIPWLLGLALVYAGTVSWLRRLWWVLATLTVLMMAVSACTYLIGSGVWALSVLVPFGSRAVRVDGLLATASSRQNDRDSGESCQHDHGEDGERGTE